MNADQAADLMVDSERLAARRRRNRIRYHGTQLAIVGVAVVLVVLFAVAVKEGLARHGIRSASRSSATRPAST